MEKTIEKEILHKGFLTLEKHQIELPNGKLTEREVIRHCCAVAVLAREGNQYIFVKQYRKAAERDMLEIPAGLIDKGEEALTAAKRELEEETQLAGEHWQKVGSFYPSPGFLTEVIDLYTCDSLSQVKNPRPADPDEVIQIVRLTLTEALDKIQSGEICDMKTALALYYAKHLEGSYDQ